MRICLILVIFMFLFGCGNPQVKESLQIQQSIIDDMGSKIEKLETKLKVQEEKIDSLQNEVNSLKQGVKKVTPGYLEGAIQEGN